MQPRGQGRDTAQGSVTSLGHRAIWDLATDGIQRHAMGSSFLVHLIVSILLLCR